MENLHDNNSDVMINLVRGHQHLNYLVTRCTDCFVRFCCSNKHFICWEIWRDTERERERAKGGFICYIIIYCLLSAEKERESKRGIYMLDYYLLFTVCWEREKDRERGERKKLKRRPSEWQLSVSVNNETWKVP